VEAVVVAGGTCLSLDKSRPAVTTATNEAGKETKAEEGDPGSNNTQT